MDAAEDRMRNVRAAVGAVAALLMAPACGSKPATPGGTGGTGAVQTFAVVPTRHQLDLLFVIDDANVAALQAKLGAQVPTLLQSLAELPGGLPDLHLAVITTDMGAPSNAGISCSATGDAGVFQTGARGACGGSPLHPGATYLAASGASQNFDGPLDIATQCLVQQGATGCGFTQPLAAVARALGADGAPPPAANAGFLRPNALLGIVLVTDQDDCSAAPGTNLFDLAGDGSIGNEPLGPLSIYRCSRFGHLCKDSSGALVMPPASRPAGQTIETLTDCVPNRTSSGLLAPVDGLVQQIKGVKVMPDSQIAVAAIAGPSAPYAVDWRPASVRNPQNPDELWPDVMHSCGPAGSDSVNPSTTQTTNDGTFGDPAVRIGHFVQQFPLHSVSSVCDPSYAEATISIVQAIGSLQAPVTYIDGAVPTDAGGQPICTAVEHDVTGAGERQTPLPSCAADGATAPCWQAAPPRGESDAGRSDAGGCAAGGRAVKIAEGDPAAGATAVYYTFACPL
jgi:hypothetical protein